MMSVSRVPALRDHVPLVAASGHPMQYQIEMGIAHDLSAADLLCTHDQIATGCLVVLA